MDELSQLLMDLRAGHSSPAALNALFRATYDELKHVAHHRLRQGRPVAGLNTTSLVHESYLRFVGAARLDISDRPHFIAYASKVMRSVVVDIVRRESADRRGGDQTLVTLGSCIKDVLARDEDVLRLDEALDELAAVDAALVQLVELRFFAGLSVEEAAECLGVSPRTAFRMWEKARLVLLDALRES